jgi:outer membrane cobalamin receptor
LSPEKSKGYDAGIDQSLFGDKVNISATYFRNDLENLLDYDRTTYKTINVNQVQTSGVETSATWRPLQWLSLNANYTYLDAKNDTTQRQLLYRPHHTTGGSVNIRPLDKPELERLHAVCGETVPGRERQYDAGVHGTWHRCVLRCDEVAAVDGTYQQFYKQIL